VYAVYEDGPLGYVLYRSLRELGVEAYVSARKVLLKGQVILLSRFCNNRVSIDLSVLDSSTFKGQVRITLCRCKNGALRKDRSA
jgi:hypothetical protein